MRRISFTEFETFLLNGIEDARQKIMVVPAIARGERIPIVSTEELQHSGRQSDRLNLLCAEHTFICQNQDLENYVQRFDDLERKLAKIFDTV